MAGACLLVAGMIVGTAADTARAADIKPALIYDLGGKFDKSFNEGAFHGAEAFKQATGIAFRDFEIQNDAQREQAMRRFAKDGFTPVVAVGFSQASALEKVAAEFPNPQVAIVAAVVAEPAGGAHSDPDAAIAAAGDAVEAALAGFDGWSRERIQAARADKFLAIGRR